MKILYSTKVTAIGGREGQAKSEDGRLDVALSIPKELGGPGAAGATNPEQLFAAGYAACFESAIRFVARSKRVALQKLSVEATVSLTPVPTGFALLVSLHVSMPDMEKALCEELIQQAHVTCPYSNAVKGNIAVEIAIN